MRKLFNAGAVTLGAATVAMLSLGLASSASEAAKPNVKNYCERVCTDDGSCFYSCSQVKPKRKIKYPPTSRPQPEPVPYVADWRDTILYPTGGSGGGGGGGGNGR